RALAPPELALTPIQSVYVGLNDLRISRNSRSIFDAVIDGTVANLRETFRDIRFGFGGLTVLDRGYPIPCRRFLEELARVGADFTFLRRSFKKDIQSRNMSEELSRLREERERLETRSSGEVQADFDRFRSDVSRAFPE
ncbi:MAG: aldolase, partial [Myxococcota bacterium]